MPDAATKLCVKCGCEPTRATRRGMCHSCYQNWWSRRRGYGTFESLFVDAEPVRQHLTALREAGLGLRRVAELSGVSREAMRCLTVGRPERGTGPSRRVNRSTAQRLLAVRLPDAPHAVAADGGRVDAIGTIRRCQALVAWGYTRTYIGEQIGWTVQNMGRLLDPATGKVNADTARKVDALFRRLQHTPGPSSRARSDGQRKGWALPFEWDEDEIDRFDLADHTDQAPTPAPEPLTFPERYAEMKDIGFTDRESSLERTLDRYDMPISPQLRVLAREERNTRAAS